MGIYDTIHSSYDLGPGFWNRELQTKDLDGYMTYNWIDPKGHLWTIDHSGTYAFEDNGTFKVVKSINRGKVTPYTLTKQIELYPANWNAHYAPCPTAMVSFFEGIVEHVLFASNQ
jgi:hypothetical protein